MIWINSELPDPEHQKILKQILIEQYPISKPKKILAYLVSFLITLPLWLVITIIEANVQEKTKNLSDSLYELIKSLIPGL